jgi:lipoprotein-anchoring transpeptidase ErfK/SrfK
MAQPDLLFVDVSRHPDSMFVTLWRRKDKPDPAKDWEDKHGFWTPIRQYRCAIGALGFETPFGPHYVTGKARNPSWRMPDSEWVPAEKRGTIIPGGVPENPLKAAFISLGGNIEDGVGLHGTADLASIGKMASHGCIRMRPVDVTDLYRRLPIGSLVFVPDSLVPTAQPV